MNIYLTNIDKPLMQKMPFYINWFPNINVQICLQNSENNYHNF